MKLIFKLILLFLIFYSCEQTHGDHQWIHDALKVSIQQYDILGENLMEDSYPASFNDDSGLQTAKSKAWISGFYPGTLWYLYKYSNDEEIKNRAIRWTEGIANQKHNKGTHDLGFMFMCSYGNGLEIGGIEMYEEVIVEAANSLTSRYNPNIGCIKSWDFFNGEDKWRQFPVIMDNMMNLELLFKATEISGDSIFYDIAVSHADKTLQNHIREDFSTYHVVDYDTITGEVIKKMTSQGYADHSMWARGQAWAIAGFTMCYQNTNDKKYLNTAIELYKHYANHENMPENNIPFWDFNDPKIPNVSRDASSAAIVAGALLQLSEYTDGAQSDQLLSEAVNILKTLSSEEYLASVGDQSGFILKHSTGHRPLQKEVDQPLSYADYYFVKALIQYLGMMGDLDSKKNLAALNQ